MVWYVLVRYGMVWHGVVWLLATGVYCLSLNSNVFGFPIASLAPRTHLGLEIHFQFALFRNVKTYRFTFLAGKAHFMQKKKTFCRALEVFHIELFFDIYCFLVKDQTARLNDKLRSKPTIVTFEPH